MGGYIGVGIVLLILGFGLAFLIIDIRNRINNSNKYENYDRYYKSQS